MIDNQNQKCNDNKPNNKILLNEIDELIEQIDEDGAILMNDFYSKKTGYQMKLFSELDHIYNDISQSLIENETMYQAMQNSLLDLKKVTITKENYLQPNITKKLKDSIELFKERQNAINNLLNTKLIYKKYLERYINLKDIIPSYDTVRFAKMINPNDSNEKQITLFNLQWIFSFKVNKFDHYDISIKNLHPIQNLNENISLICHFTIKRGKLKYKDTVNTITSNGVLSEISINNFIDKEEIKQETYLFKIQIRFKTFIDEMFYNNINIHQCSPFGPRKTK